MNIFQSLRLATVAFSMVAVPSVYWATASASSHREAPYIAKYPQVDGTDFYAFNSYEPGREEYVTFLANYIPVQAAYGGPNYFLLDENALYEIHIDNDGDAIEDLTFQFRFNNKVPESGILNFPIGTGENQKNIDAVLRNVAPISADAADGLNYRESYSVRLMAGDRRRGRGAFLSDPDSGSEFFAKPFDYSGTKTFGGPGQYTIYANSFIHDVNIPNCIQPGKVFVGQRLEPFKIALGETFDLVNFVPVEGDSAPGAGDGAGFPGGVTQDPNRNVLQKNNITTIALEVPKACLTGSGNGVIGSWTSASLRQATVLNPKPTLERPEIELVRMPEGPVGYVHSRYTTPPDIAGRARTVGTLVSFRFEPRSGVAPVTRLSDGSPLLIVGREGEWWRVRYREAPVWVKSNVLQPVVDRQRGVDAWDALGKQLRADNVAFAKELAAKEAALAAENARRELLQSINTRFVAESRKPVREQDYDPLLAEIGVMLEELTEDAPEHVTLTKLRSEIERSQKMAKAVRLADVEEPPAPVEVADPVIETPPDPTERFEAIGWIVARRLRNGEPRYELQQGGLTTMLLQSRRYDLQQFAGYEVGVNGTPFRAHLSSDRRLDVQEIEVLSARRRRR